MIQVWLFLGALAASLILGAQTPSVFRLHLLSEPSSLKPWELKNSNGLYFLGQIYGSLLKYQDQKLKGDLAEECWFQSAVKVRCRLKKNLSFSDGTAIQAEHFVKSFQEFLKPINQAFRADLLFSVKNAEQVFLGKLPPDKLGLKALQPTHLEFELEKADPEFLFTLTSPLLTPFKHFNFPALGADAIQQFPTSGTYKIISWKAGDKIQLEHRQKPSLHVEFLFISEDATALNLYRKNELQFLRRLPTLYIPEFRDSAEFHQQDQIRFDYIGFGPELKTLPELRKALSLSLDFKTINSLLFTKGSFGCAGLPASVFKELPCLIFNLDAAKAALAKLSPKKLPPLSLTFSKQGGDDFKRTMEWIQAEWKKNLGLKVELIQLENKIFVQQLEKAPPSLFRKGVAPERPTCLSALEFFGPGSQENYLKNDRKEFLSLYSKLQNSSRNHQKYQKTCTQIVQHLLDNYLLIPAGPIYFSYLVKKEWVGWKLNELNQLDLSDLKFKN